MNLRDKIAQTIADDYVRGGKNLLETTEAILTTIKANVPDLEWSEWHGYNLHTWNNLAALASAKSCFGRYSIGRLHKYLPPTNKRVRPFDHEYSDEWWVEVPLNKGELLGPFGHDVEAKTAANAHHKAQLLQAMGIEECRRPVTKWHEHHGPYTKWKPNDKTGSTNDR